jgi:hypothetical protein
MYSDMFSYALDAFACAQVCYDVLGAIELDYILIAVYIIHIMHGATDVPNQLAHQPVSSGLV